MTTTGTQHVKNWYQRLKQQLIIGFGGKCCVCGYSKCSDVLEFHHLDPTKKDFSISGYKIKNKMKIFAEIKKCVMLCANCHREYHAGVIEITTPISFNENLIPPKEVKIYKCQICEKETKNARFCSLQCTGIFNSKNGLTNEVILELCKTKSYNEVAKLYGVSYNAIRKRHKKLIHK